MLKVTLDSNVIISALISPGTSRKVLDLVHRGEIELFISPHILQETAGVLQEKFTWDPGVIKVALAEIKKLGITVNPGKRLFVIKDDESDNRIVECAVAGNVDFLITGDHHILSVKEYAGIKFIKPGDLLKALKS